MDAIIEHAVPRFSGHMYFYHVVPMYSGHVYLSAF